MTQNIEIFQSNFLNFTLIELKGLKIFTLAHPALIQEKSQLSMENILLTLKDLGVKTLLSLEEKNQNKIQEALEKNNLFEQTLLPIEDYQPANLEQMLEVIRIYQNFTKKDLEINSQNKKQALAIHCQYGLGRTGTLCAGLVLFNTLKDLKKSLNVHEKQDFQEKLRTNVLFTDKRPLCYHSSQGRGQVQVPLIIYQAVNFIRQSLLLSPRSSPQAQFIETEKQIEFLEQWVHYLIEHEL